MVIKIDLAVKFRAFGIDFYKFHQIFVEPLPVPGVFTNTTLIKYNDHGVNMVVTLERAGL